MSENAPIPIPSIVDVESTNRTSRWLSFRQLLATLLSAACPGTGHFIFGQMAKGMLLSALFAVLISAFLALRLPRYYVGLAALGFSWLALGVYSACSAELIRNPQSGYRISKWWFAFTLPVVLLIVTFTGRGIVRASGFTTFDIPSDSMEPTIQKGDRIVVDTRAFRSRVPQYQEVIVFH